MSKTLKIMIYTFMILVLIICIIKVMNPSKGYDEGRDTIKSYGSGEYQLLRIKNEKGNEIRSLTNCKYNEAIIDNVLKEEKIKNRVYFIGSHYNNQVKAILNLNDNTIKYYAYIPDGETFNIIYLNEMMDNHEIEVSNKYSIFTSEEQNFFEKLKEN